MDIVELSLKMEADLLESHLDKSSYLKYIPEENFSPRITRSQTNKNTKPTIEKSAFEQPKKNYRKVDEAEKIYLNKKAKTVHKNLETIYEVPLWKKGNTMLLGNNKVRSIYLDQEFRVTSKQKSKLRKMKIKRLGKKKKLIKMSDEEFKIRMLRIENYINENDVEAEYENKNCDYKLINCDKFEICTKLKNGNAELNGSDGSINAENITIKD